MTYDQIIQSLKKKTYKPVYFLYGNESYFIDAISDYVEANVLSEGEKAFNFTVLYGKDTDHLTVVDNARRYPMMSPYQVVILKEAQEMKTLKDLQTYVEKPLDTTILVICHKHKSFNMNTKFGKALKQHAVVFQSKKLYDNQVPDWIKSYLTRKKLQISMAGSELLAEYLGSDLSKVANELDKLAINLEPGTEVTANHIEENIGISKEYNIFELQKALGARDVLKANRIVKYFTANPKSSPLPVLIGSLYNYFSKIYMLHFLRNASEQELLNALGLRSPFFLREYRATARVYSPQRTEWVIQVLKEFDLKSKGVEYNNTGKPDGELLKEMVWRILH